MMLVQHVALNQRISPFQAALFCNKMNGATLPLVESTDDQAFFAGYLPAMIPSEPRE